MKDALTTHLATPGWAFDDVFNRRNEFSHVGKPLLSALNGNKFLGATHGR